MKLQKQHNITIEGLLNAIAQMQDGGRAAANIMVALVDKDPRIYEKIMKQAPTVSLNLLVTLEKVGRGTLYPALLFDSSPGARRLMLLPYSQQKEAYEKPIKVVSMKAGKKIETEKAVQSLTPAETRIVFAEDRIRSTAEQVKVIDQMQVVAHQGKPAQRYSIMPNGNLVIHFANTEFTPGQLEDIFSRVKDKAIKSLKAA